MTQTGALLVYQLILTVQVKFRDHGKISVIQCGTRIRCVLAVSVLQGHQLSLQIPLCFSHTSRSSALYLRFPDWFCVQERNKTIISCRVCLNFVIFFSSLIAKFPVHNIIRGLVTHFLKHLDTAAPVHSAFLDSQCLHNTEYRVQGMDVTEACVYLRGRSPWAGMLDGSLLQMCGELCIQV